MAEKQVLDSWKEIADYLMRSVKTCQRIEHELGLPIHRLADTPKARVFAYKEEIDRWIKKTQHSEKEIFFRKSRLKKLLIPALVIIILAIIAVGIWQPWSKKAPTLLPSDKPSLAVMYFENNTGEDGLEHYRKALSDLLITDLSQSKFINVLRGDRLFNILSQLNQLEAKSYSSDVLREVADRGRINHILQGNYSKAGENFRINIMLHDANTDELISSESVEGRGEESIFSMVDELTRKIKANFKLSAEQIAGDIDREVGKITTSSPEAYKYYTEGFKNFLKGNSPRCIQFMEKAVALDPEFALAYSDMASSYAELGNSSESRKYFKKAIELSHRVSDRERYLIIGDFNFYQTNFEKSIEAYNKVLELYPDDMLASSWVGIVYGKLEEWNKAQELLEANLRNRDEKIFTYTNLSLIYNAKGLYDKSREILEYYLNNFSDNVLIHRCLAYIYICQGKYDLALSEADKVSRLDPTQTANFRNFSFKGDIFHLKGEFSKAEMEYQKLLDRGWSRGHNRLASLYLAQGQLKKALGEALSHRSLAYLHLADGNAELALEELEIEWNQAVGADQISRRQREALFLKGLIFIRVGSFDETKRIADEIKESVDQGMNKKAMRYYYDLMGRIELKRENLSQAIEYSHRAISLLPSQMVTSDSHALYMDSLAFAYYKSGDFEKAIEEYERITSLTTGRFYYGDIYAKAFYMLGKIYEQQGDTAKAIEHYEKFLDLWKDADHGIAEVEDAKKRLAGLRAQ